MAKSDIKISGTHDAMKAIEKFKASTQRKLLRKALNTATQEIVKKVKANTPKQSGALKRSITKKVKTTRDKNLYGLVGPSRKAYEKTKENGKTETRKPSKYAHLVEKGSKPHKIKLKLKNGTEVEVNHPGATGKNFMKNGYNAALPTVKDIMLNKLAKEAEKEASRLQNRRKK